MGRRTLLLIAAFLVAAVGATFIFLYVRGVDERAQAGQRLVEILVVKSDIPAGTAATSLGGDLVQKKRIAADAAAKGALSSIEPVADKVTLVPLYPGEHVIARKFGNPGSSPVLPVNGNTIAVAVQLADPARVAGFVQPGSKVAVFVTVRAQGAGGAGGGGAGGGATSTTGDYTRVLLEKAEVVAAGPATAVSTTSANGQTGETNTEQIPKAILTLALSPRDAQRLVYAQGHGELYFGLLGKESKPETGIKIDAENLFR